MKLSIFTVLLLVCSLERGQSMSCCVPLKEAPTCQCACVLIDGSGKEGRIIDLRRVANHEGQPAFAVTNAEYTFTYNPCYSFTIGSGCADVAGCEQDTTYKQEYSLGVQTNVQFDVDGDDVVINYSGGIDDRTFEVTLNCSTEENYFVFNEEMPALHYRFTLTSPCACPDYCTRDDGTDPGAV